MEAPPATTAPAAPPAPARRARCAAGAQARGAQAQAPEPGPPAALPPAPPRDSAVWNLPIRTYLDQTIVPIMLDGMAVSSQAIRTLRRVAAMASGGDAIDV